MSIHEGHLRGSTFLDLGAASPLRICSFADASTAAGGVGRSWHRPPPTGVLRLGRAQVALEVRWRGEWLESWCERSGGHRYQG